MTTATVDERKRIRIPEAKPGEVYAIETSLNGHSIRLTRVEPVSERPAKVRWLKRDGFTVGVTDRPIDEKVARELLEEFP